VFFHITKIMTEDALHKTLFWFIIPVMAVALPVFTAFLLPDYSTIRKYTKAKTVFPDDQAALKAVYLAIANVEKKWTFPVRDWGSIINQLIIKFGDRCGVL